MSKTKLELMTERCGQAEVRENNLIVAIEKAVEELENQNEDAALITLTTALKENDPLDANKKE
jgi:hypothetical protein